MTKFLDSRVKLRMLFLIILVLQLHHVYPQKHENFDKNNISNLIQAIVGKDFNSNDEQIPIRHAPLELINKSYKNNPEKDWTLLIYMAADNDLQRYAIRNIKQMATIGSTANINVVIHLDIRLNNKKNRFYFYIEKDNITEFTQPQKWPIIDSGNPDALIAFVKWAVEKFPARHYMLDCWDHATGIIDPMGSRIVRASNLFRFNPETNKLELDRSVDYLDYASTAKGQKTSRGACWDDTTGHYLTNQKIVYALESIKNDPTIMQGRKFSILGFDACLMSMIEIGALVKDYAEILVSSQEVELGTGWNYQSILTPFTQTSMTPEEFATHIVNIYEKTYGPHTNDYTLSAINLNRINDIEENLNTVSQLLIECLQNQRDNSVKRAIVTSRNRRLCTHFDTPQYIDLHHFYRNLQLNIPTMYLTRNQIGARLRQTLADKLAEGKTLIENIVIANVTGKNLSQARGLSIYFPEQRIHPSYNTTAFASNAWANLIRSTLAIA